MSVPQGPPLQGQLFDANALEKQNRVALAKERLPSGSKRNTIRDDLRDQVMQITSIPTSHLQPRPEIRKSKQTGEAMHRPETLLLAASGHYQPERVRSTATHKDSNDKWVRQSHIERDTIGVPNSGWDRQSTLVHEMGHRHHIDKTGGQAHSAKEQAADPLHEGHADGYVDRHFPRSPQAQDHLRSPNQMASAYEAGSHPFAPGRVTGPGRMQITGYSTNFKGDSRRGPSWDATDRALYAATRANYYSTGETVNYPDVQYTDQEVPRTPSHLGNDRRPRAATDAALHGLVTSNPASREAVANTAWMHKGEAVSMDEAADAAVRRHNDRQLLRQGQYVQEDLFGDRTNWRNQQGEQPRTLEQVSSTLKLNEQTKNAAPGATIRRGLL